MNYPATITCKLCEQTVANPILEQTRGRVVFSTCQSCRDGLLGRFGRNRRKQNRVGAAHNFTEEVTHDTETPSRTMDRVKLLLKNYLSEEKGWLI